MEIRGYHGTTGQAVLHHDFCLTNEIHAARDYAAGNDGDTVTEMILDTDGLTVEDVDYDYDGCEPVIPDECTADVVEFLDCDEQGRTHRTWMLLTDAALAAVTITGSIHTDDI